MKDDLLKDFKEKEKFYDHNLNVLLVTEYLILYVKKFNYREGYELKHDRSKYSSF